MVTNLNNISNIKIPKVIDEISLDLYTWGKSVITGIRFKNREKTGEIYQKYLNKSKEKHSKVKTLLYKNEPKNIYDFYEPTTLEEHNKRKIDTTNSSNIFNINKKIIISGTGGIGKSFLMKHIFINQIEQDNSIPIFIDLKSRNSIDNSKIEDLENFVYDSVNSEGLTIKKEEFIFTLEKGVYTILFDGFDEIDSIYQDHFQNQLKQMVDKYHLNRFVVSSRPQDTFIGWHNFDEYKIQELSKAQSINLISRLDYDSNTKDLFIKELDNKLYDSHRSFASIPLLLTVMLMTFEADANIPDDLTEFYNQAFYTLYLKHDASKSGYKRELKAKFSAEEFKDIISYVAMHTFLKNQVEFTLDNLEKYLNKYQDSRGIKFKNSFFKYDAINSVCLLIQEGNGLQFSHRSFQEYFAGIGVSKLLDNQQKTIFNSWNKENAYALSLNKTFIKALLSLQKERTYINLFIPMINNLENDFKQCNENMTTFIPKIFSHVSVTKKNHVGVYISSESVCSSFSSLVKHITSNYEARTLPDYVLELQKELISNVKLQRRNDKGHKLSYSYQLNKHSTKPNESMELAAHYAIALFDYDYNRLLDFKKNVSNRNKSNKRRLDSILEDI